MEWVIGALSNSVLYEAYWNLPVETQLKHIGLGSVSAILTISSHLDCINETATEFGIEPEMIQAVLFRELICIGLEDIVGDIRFRLAGIDCSTGIGQIKASTAINAEKTILGSCNKSVSEMWDALQDPCTNIRYVGMNLKAILSNNDLMCIDEGRSNGMKDIELVFARYNGTRLNENTSSYARSTYCYYQAFKTLQR